MSVENQNADDDELIKAKKLAELEQRRLKGANSRTDDFMLKTIRENKFKMINLGKKKWNAGTRYMDFDDKFVDKYKSIKI